jgi:hypothetical protein
MFLTFEHIKKSENLKKHIPRRLFTGKFKEKYNSFMSNKNDFN